MMLSEDFGLRKRAGHTENTEYSGDSMANKTRMERNKLLTVMKEDWNRNVNKPKRRKVKLCILYVISINFIHHASRFARDR